MIAARRTACVSYARSDGAAFAADLRARLQSEGFSLWQDLADMEGGRDWWQQIETAIRAVEYLLLVMTPDALRKESVVRNEWRFARQEGTCVIPIIPIIGGPGITSGTEFGGLPRWMQRAHWMDPGIPEQWQRLLSMLRSPCQQQRVPFMAGDLPADFVARENETRVLMEQLLKPGQADLVAMTGALRGAGGYGKTVLAKAICHQDSIQEAFDDGILWVTLGAQAGDLRGRIADLIQVLTGVRPAFEHLTAATTQLREALGERRMLLVIDDLWDPADCQPFLEGGGNCARLITTRDQSSVPDTASCVPVNAMRPDEALNLLRFGLPAGEDDALRDLAERLGEWPLLLKLTNAALRERVATARQPLYGAIRYVNQALDRKGLTAFDRTNARARDQAVEATLRMSLDQLPADERERFSELAVFAEDADIPLPAVEALWNSTGSLDEFATEELCLKLYRLSLLLNLDLGTLRLRLHDIIRSYHLPRDLPARQALHGKLLAAYRQKCPDGWATGPNDGYYFQWLPHHLVEAGLAEELRALLLDYRWLAAKLAASGIQALIADYDRLPDDEEELRLVRHALALSVHVLAKSEDQDHLPGQLIGRLVGLGGDGVAALLAEARKERRFTWLRPLTRSLIPAGGPLLRALPNFDQDVARLAISADARRVRIEFENGSVDVWDLKRGLRLEGAEASGDEFGSLEQQAGEVPVFDASSGHRPGTSVMCCAISEAGDVAISGGEDWDLKLWDVPNRSVIATLPFHQDIITAVALTPGGLHAVSAARGTVLVWDLHQAQQSPPDERKLPIKAVDFAAESGSEVVAFEALDWWPWDNAVHLWDLTCGREVDRLEGHEKPVNSVAVTADGRCVVSGSEDETVRVWDTASPSELTSLQGHSGPVNAVAVTPDGRLAVSGSQDNTVRIWDLERKREQKNLEIEGIVKSVSATPDGHHVVAGTDIGIVRHWDLSDQCSPVHQTQWSRVEVSAVVVTPDGDNAVFALSDGSLRAWDLTTGADVSCLSTGMTAVSSVAITPDGHRAVSGSDDKAVRVWDLRDRREIARFTADNPVRAVACGGNAQIIAGDGGGQIHLLELIEGRSDA